MCRLSRNSLSLNLLNTECQSRLCNGIALPLVVVGPVKGVPSIIKLMLRSYEGNRSETVILCSIKLHVTGLFFSFFRSSFWHDSWIWKFQIEKSIYKIIQLSRKFVCLQKKKYFKGWLSLKDKNLNDAGSTKLFASYCYSTILHAVGLPLRKEKRVQYCVLWVIYRRLSF